MEIIEFSFRVGKNFFFFDIMAPNFDTFQYNPFHLFPSADFCVRSTQSTFRTFPSPPSSTPSPQTFTNLLNLDFLLVNLGNHFFTGKLNFFHYYQQKYFSYQHGCFIFAQLLEDKDIWFQFIQPSSVHMCMTPHFLESSFHDGAVRYEFLNSFRRVILRLLALYFLFHNFRKQVFQSTL